MWPTSSKLALMTVSNIRWQWVLYIITKVCIWNDMQLSNANPTLGTAISDLSQLAGASASLLEIHKHTFWKTEDIIQCQLTCANLFPQRNLWHVDNTDLVHLQSSTVFALFIIYIVCTYCMLYFDCWVFSRSRALTGLVYYVKLLPTWDNGYLSLYLSIQAAYYYWAIDAHVVSVMISSRCCRVAGMIATNDVTMTLKVV